jgi:hypothetical protein
MSFWLFMVAGVLTLIAVILDHPDWPDHPNVSTP